MFLIGSPYFLIGGATVEEFSREVKSIEQVSLVLYSEDYKKAVGVIRDNANISTLKG